MDIGMVLLAGFFAWLLWAALKSRPGEARVCTRCAHHGPTRTHTRGSLLIELVLWLCFIIPGLIYSIWRHASRQQVCSACGSDQLVPPDTPAGRRLMAEHHSGTAKP